MAEPISVFLSYRRSDTPYAAGRLADRLGERFKLFMDIDIAPGLHFGRALTEAVEGCDVMVVLIGPSWLSAVEEDGSRRLDNPRDWVVQEIEAALAREVTVIPVLVDGARMPTPDQLPAPLEALAFRQALSLRHESFATDITTLIGAVDRAAPGGPDAAPTDRKVEERMAEAWRQLKGKPDAPVATPPADRALRVPLIVAGVSYLTMVIWSLPLAGPDDLGASLVPSVIITVLAVAYLPVMWWSTRNLAADDRRALWRSAAIYAGAAIPLGLVLALLTVNISATSVTAIYWLLLYAVVALPGAAAYLMMRGRFGRAALWPAGLAYLVCAAVLLISAVQLA